MSGAEREPGTIVRYRAGTRTNHWIVALAFILAALSGLALFHPALFWLSELFGGGPWTRILHPFIALIMVLAFVFLAAVVWKDNLMQPRDWAWLKLWRDVVDNREEALPEVGRYNGGQKLLFVLMVLTLAGLFVSGILIWRTYFGTYFSVHLIRAAALVHAVCAFALICGIIVHIYAAFWVKGSLDAMTRGTVTAGWAFKHHRAWLREVRHGANSRSRPD